MDEEVQHAHGEHFSEKSAFSPGCSGAIARCHVADGQSQHPDRCRHFGVGVDAGRNAPRLTTSSSHTPTSITSPHLPLMLDAVSSLRSQPVQGHRQPPLPLQAHVFNNIVWLISVASPLPNRRFCGLPLAAGETVTAAGLVVQVLPAVPQRAGCGLHAVTRPVRLVGLQRVIPSAIRRLEALGQLCRSPAAPTSVAALVIKPAFSNRESDPRAQPAPVAHHAGCRTGFEERPRPVIRSISPTPPSETEPIPPSKSKELKEDVVIFIGCRWAGLM